MKQIISFCLVIALTLPTWASDTPARNREMSPEVLYPQLVLYTVAGAPGDWYYIDNSADGVDSITCSGNCEDYNTLGPAAAAWWTCWIVSVYKSTRITYYGQYPIGLKAYMQINSIDGYTIEPWSSSDCLGGFDGSGDVESPCMGGLDG